MQTVNLSLEELGRIVNHDNADVEWVEIKHGFVEIEVKIDRTKYNISIPIDRGGAAAAATIIGPRVEIENASDGQ